MRSRSCDAVPMILLTLGDRREAQLDVPSAHLQGRIGYG
jgi:hypothetical protein